MEQEEFPRSYSVEFRGPEKIYLPIPGMPKKGVNQLFACAVQHPKLHPAMERYARLAMRSLSGTKTSRMKPAPCPALSLCLLWGWRSHSGVRWCATILDLCDDEHSSLQEKFIHAFFKKYGFYGPDHACLGSWRPVYAGYETG